MVLQTRFVYGLQARFPNSACIWLASWVFKLYTYRFAYGLQPIGLQGLQQKICKVAFGLQTAKFAYGQFLQSAWGGGGENLPWFKMSSS